METRDFIAFCEAAEHGAERYVRYIDRHAGGAHEHVGRVIGCDGRRLEVVAEDGHHTWPMEHCEPLA